MLTKYVDGIDLLATSTDAKRGIELIHNFQPDLVFLDINMPGLNGFELLEKLQCRNFFLVFCTAHEEYGLRALKSYADDYLLKPVDVFALQATIDRIRKKMEKQIDKPNIMAILREVVKSGNTKVPLISKDTIEYVIPCQIVYVQANSHNSVIMLKNGIKKQVRTGLRHFEMLLCKPGSQFMRIHHSFIINLEHVTAYSKEDGGYVRMNEKKSIPVSKYKKDAFFSRINVINKP